MTRTSNQTDAQTAPSDGDDDYIHIASYTQWVLDRLGLKIPRALCGVLLVQDPDKPHTPFSAPTCPKCILKDAVG